MYELTFQGAFLGVRWGREGLQARDLCWNPSPRLRTSAFVLRSLNFNIP